MTLSSTMPHGAVVALLEDNALVRRSIEQYLSLRNLTVLSGENGLDLLSAARRRRVLPDVIVSDYWIARDSALTVVPAVLTNMGVDVPVIIITGDVSLTVRAAVVARGWSVLVKPFHPNDLLLAITLALQNAPGQP
ncbi:response regulator [Azospirillum canadense]|uniref:response regulator n=1 Tax=Azospirillum canadense TaxID=403962 RepID=UPI0022265FC8|nr:response regulator [Azospirillum canadense]MCW2240448.1 DNA-binding response OmpR family regulator [Azospirillum canadense]